MSLIGHFSLKRFQKERINVIIIDMEDRYGDK